MENLREMIQHGLAQGFVSVAQLDAAEQASIDDYGIGAIHGALAALAYSGIHATLTPPQETRTEDRDVVLGSAAQLSIRLPVHCWLELYNMADRAGQEFTAIRICAELAYLEHQIAEMLAAVQLPLTDGDNGTAHEPDSTLKSFIPVPVTVTLRKEKQDAPQPRQIPQKLERNQ